MSDTIVREERSTRADEWRARIAEQGRSGLSIKQFCRERGLSLWSFYTWRKRLQEAGSVRFALVERGTVGPEGAAEARVELVLPGGERLRIGSGVDGATLRTVLEALRG
jgi:hypothetical protein